MIWLALSASHVVSDFLLQSGFVEERRGARLTRHALVTALTCGLALLVLERWVPTGLSVGHVVGIAGVVGLLHGVQDALVTRIQSKVGKAYPPVLRLVVDQATHLVVLWGVAAAARHLPRAAAVTAGAAHMEDTAHTVLWSVIFFTLGTAVTAVLIAHLLEPYRLAMIQDASQDASASLEQEGELLPKAGLWIGLCERFLLILAIVLGAEVVPAVGLLMGVKSIYRFRDLERRVRAEYYLLGTLLSITAAVVFGIALRWMVIGRSPVVQVLW